MYCTHVPFSGPSTWWSGSAGDVSIGTAAGNRGNSHVSAEKKMFSIGHPSKSGEHVR